MRSRRAQLTLAAVALVLGFLAIVQLRAQGSGSGLQDLSAQDLTVLIANLNQRNTELAAEVTSLQGTLSGLRAAQAAGATSLGGLQDDLRRIRRWAGLDPVRGRGVAVDVLGPAGADVVNGLLNDLRLAGAEALAVDTVRVTARSVVAGTPGRLTIDGRALPAEFQVLAIGNPVNLTGALTRAGGAISRVQVTSPGAQLAVAPSDTIELPASSLDLIARDAKPRI